MPIGYKYTSYNRIRVIQYELLSIGHKMVTEENSVSTLQDIDERRKLLQKVVAVARAIEDLQHSLNAVLVLGDTETQLPKNAYQLYQNLSNKVRDESTETIQEYYDKLQALITSELSKIIAYSSLEEDESGNLPFTEDALALLQRFRREAQTTVSLRILLKERGVAVSGSTFAIPANEIRTQLTNLDKKERKQRKKVHFQIRLMQEELKAMIKSDSFSDEMKQPMKQALAGLDADLKVIDSGRSIDSMELSFEAVETEEKLYAAEDQKAEDRQSSTKQATEKPKEKIGFFQKLVRWLNSPWSVSWRQAGKKGKRSAKGDE